ncbi:phospholipase D-like domain-containing protein, partial [Paracoccus sphaerophysae]
PETDAPAVAEIERLYLDSIAAARRSIYIESQYFAADGIAEAIARRLAEPDGPEVVVVNPAAAQGAIEDAAMHVTRSRLMLALQAADRHGRFRLLSPVSTEGAPIYVHAKLVIADDEILRVGSSNIDRRSMGFDTEADVAVLATTARDRDRIRAIRHERLAEHLGATPEQVEAAGGMIAALDRLNHGPRRLVPIEPREPGLLGRFLSDTRLFDPRYRRSAQSRLGLTGRHVFLAVGAAAALGLIAWRRSARRRR